ncbi:MAG: CDP-archaeol synthase [Candidatus Pacebacteria bacterium]|nr:CDP-archaeol synthase [Candidatus Paceibacterota bacterium]
MAYVFILIVQSIWFSLPIYAANMAPVIVKKIPFLAVPIDMGKTWRGKPIFGSHKTVRGFVFGILSAVIVIYIQKVLFLKGGVWESMSIVDYEMFPFIFLGFLFGLGALVGDAIESFFKRRIDINSGEPWLIFDQVDYIIGALLFISVLYIPPIPHIIVILAIGVVASFVTSYIGYYMGLKDSKI